MISVLDLEFNQAFDFGNNKIGNQVNPKCRFEIIQIGAVKVDSDYKVIDRFNTYIKPSLYPRIHPYVEKITGFTENSFIDSPTFPEAYLEFRKFLGDDTILGTWGYSDIKALFRNITFHNMHIEPIIMEYVDIQNLATNYLKFSKGGAIGLKSAVEKLEININDKIHFHNALGDAYYTAKVLQKINPNKPLIRIFNSKHIKQSNNN